MVFETNNRYVITSIESDTLNYYHDEMRGHLCEIESMDVGDVGWMTVRFDDGIWHMIHTSEILSVEVTEPDQGIVVKTRNSRYVFSKVNDDGGEPDAPDAA